MTDSFLGTVNKLIDQVVKDAFSGAKKKTQAMWALPRLFDAAIGKADKQIGQIDCLQFLRKGMEERIWESQLVF